jgi:acyl-CoA synthetase (AMP-forming)/AMP-acid ligase II
MPFLTEKLHPERYRADLTALVSITRPAAIVTYPEFHSEVEQALQPGGPVRRVLTCDQAGEPLDPDWEALPGLQRSPEDITLLQHSSGTTGLQKGVALSHRAVLNQIESYSRALDFSPQDVVVSWLPLYHDMGLIAGFVMPILGGARLVLLSPFDWVRAPYRLLQAVSNYRGTLTWLPNFAYNFCAAKVRDRDLQSVNLASWRAVINCSEPVHWESHRRFHERFAGYGLRWEALATCYAMAENVFAVTQSRLGQPPQVDEIDRQAFQEQRVARPVPITTPALLPEGDGGATIKMLSNGPPVEGVQVRVLDETGRVLPERRVGEIALYSNCMLSGYYNRPDATEKAFRDGWYLTGDYGYLLDGELYVAGRKKDLIIVGGKNVYPQDLEELAMEVAGIHPGRVSAFGVYNDELGTEEVVLVAEVDGATGDVGRAERAGAQSSAAEQPEIEQLAEMVRQHVTRNSAVALRQVYLVEPGWLIKTSSGKTARSANREKFLKETGVN